MAYKPPIRGKFLKKKPASIPTIDDFNASAGNIVGLAADLRELKNEVVDTVDYKLEEIDTKLKDIEGKADDTIANITPQVIKNIQAQAIDLIREIKVGPPGQNANEQRIIDSISYRFPTADKVAEIVLAKIPKIDEKAITKRILQTIPANKESLKIIQKNFQLDPMSVIEKIMALPEGKFKLKTNHIDGLQQTMDAFRSQLGRGYLHGGGDTVTAGTNITIVTNAAGQKVISSTGGTSLTLTTTGTSGVATLVGSVLNIPNYTYTLPTASTSVLGGVKVDGTTITISGGVISAVSGGSGTVTSVASADGSITVTNPTTTVDLAVVKAPKWSTARNLAGNSVDGSANVAFANKFIVQGTTDTGLSGAQFLGALSTGLVKNTTTTGILSIAIAGTDYLTPSTGVTSITGTANQVIASAATGAVTLSLPQSIATSSTPQFAKLGIGTAADASRLLLVQGDVSGGVATINRLNSATSAVQGTMIIAATSTGTASVGFGSAFQFALGDTTAATITLTSIRAILSGGTLLSGAQVDLDFNTSAAASALTLKYNGRFNFTQPAYTSGSDSAGVFTPGAHTNQTASTEEIDYNFAMNRTVQFATGALTTQRALLIQAPTYGFVGASTITTAASVAITGAPIAGTNATITNRIALWIQNADPLQVGTAGSSTGTINFAGATSGVTILTGSAAASGTLTLPAATDTLIGKATTDALTNKTLTSSTNNVTAKSLFSATTTIDVSAATAPTSGQVLTATSSTTATWQTSSGGGATTASNTYTGNGGTNTAIPHGLGATPKFVWITDYTASNAFTMTGNPGNLQRREQGVTTTVTAMDSTNFYVSANANNNGTIYYWYAST